MKGQFLLMYECFYCNFTYYNFQFEFEKRKKGAISYDLVSAR